MQSKNAAKKVHKKPVVAMYYSYGDRIGGPLTYINTVINSELQKKYDFKTCYQNKAPGGLDIKLLKDMVTTLRQMKPDIVHVQGAQSEGFYGAVAARLAGCKQIIMTIHGFAHDDSGCRGIKHFLYKNIVEPVSIRLSHQVYCVCEFASKRPIVVKNSGKRNYGFVHNPVPELTVKCSRQEIRSGYGIGEEETVLCIAGRLTREKGFDLLCEAVKLLNERNIGPFRLMVLGDGPYRQRFSSEMQAQIESGQVILVGQTDDVASYLGASDVFIFPSYHENLSIALLEACASGLPCIVGNVGGNAEIIQDGKSGYVIEPLRAEAFADCAQKLITDTQLRQQMGAFAKKDILERFSLTRMCQKIDEVYSNYGL